MVVIRTALTIPLTPASLATAVAFPRSRRIPDRWAVFQHCSGICGDRELNFIHLSDSALLALKARLIWATGSLQPAMIAATANHGVQDGNSGSCTASTKNE